MAAETERADYDELCFYTLAHRDSSFIHQHVVDAYAAQHADENTKPIGLTFALIGLYLQMEKKYSGRQVQRAHRQLAKTGKRWPRFTIPAERGSVTVSDVVALPPGRARDDAIQRWCSSVWASWAESHDEVRNLVRAELLR
jgi:hypothetical protein